MTEEQLKAYLDSRKMDVVDATFDASIDILILIVNQNVGINLNNPCAQQCIALASKGSSEAMNELVRRSAIDMAKAEKISFYWKILQNISDFCSLGESLVNLGKSIQRYYTNEDSSAGNILGNTFSALSAVTGMLSGPIGGIISTQLSIASDLAGEASTIVSKYKERYEQYENIDKENTSSSEYDSLKEEFEEMKKSATESKESFNLFKAFINNYRQLLSALGCDLSELDNQIRKTESYYNGQNSISDYESKISGIFSDSSLAEDYKSYLNKGGMNEAEKSQKYDPLIIDLDGDGIFTKSRESGVYFDFDGDGFKEKTAWVDDGDGMLVYDRDGNGIIDDGSELFGDKTVLSNGSLAANGFEALAELDSNSDGIINKEDERFNQLRVWIDKNSDGISQADELFTLDELGIESISLGKKAFNKTENGGNIVANIAAINYKDNTKGEIGEIHFDIDSMDTINELVSNIRSEIKDNMPQIFVTGNMLDLQEAMELDDRLYDMVKGFTTSKDLYSLKNLTTEILYRWAGVENVKDGSRGAYVDAKELAVIEKFYGKGFVGVNGTNPNNTAGPILTKVYDKLFNSIYYGMLSQTVLKDYYGLVSVRNYIVSGEKKLDCSRAMEKFEKELSVNYKATIMKLAMFFEALENSSNTSSMYNKKDIIENCKNSKYLEEIKYACNGKVVYDSENGTNVNGTSSDDLIISTNNSNRLYGGAGNDEINEMLGNIVTSTQILITRIICHKYLLWEIYWKIIKRKIEENLYKNVEKKYLQYLLNKI